MGQNTNLAKASSRISGLDSIRFICAAIVLLGHAPPPFPASLKIANSFYAILFNGPAAVIVFFIISGFCIHIPQAKNHSYHVDAVPFLARRMIRLGIPAAIAAILYLYCGADLQYPSFGVLWSIICEGVYYLLYPLLLAAAHRFGWMRLIVATAIVALLAVLANIPLIVEHQNAYIALGLFTWVVGLPVWLGGCWLAEHWKRFPVPNLAFLNSVRLAVFAASIVLRAVKFHVAAPFGTNTVWLNVFAIGVVYWLGCEIAYRQNHPAPAFAEKAGLWSYSLYLVHPAVIALMAHNAFPSAASAPFLAILASFIGAYLFFRVIEHPSQQLAVTLSNRLRKA